MLREENKQIAPLREENRDLRTQINYLIPENTYLQYTLNNHVKNEQKLLIDN